MNSRYIKVAIAVKVVNDKKSMSATKVDKPWGFELRFVRTDRYAGKALFIKAGSQLSLQYHEKKDEAFYVQSGTLDLVLGKGKDQTVVRMKPGDSRRIPPGTVGGSWLEIAALDLLFPDPGGHVRFRKKPPPLLRLGCASPGKR